MMTAKDKKLIAEAENVAFFEWYMVDELKKYADSNECVRTLHGIMMRKYHEDELYAHML